MHVITNMGAKQLRRGRMLLRTLATGAAATVIAVAAPAGTANAAEANPFYYLKQGADSGKVEYDGGVTICDNEADGHQAYIKFWREAGDDTFWWNDSNGSASGCTKGDWGDVTWRWNLDYFKVCERINNLPDKCTGKVYITWDD
jgi:hypothetical protein